VQPLQLISVVPGTWPAWRHQPGLIQPHQPPPFLVLSAETPEVQLSAAAWGLQPRKLQQEHFRLGHGMSQPNCVAHCRQLPAASAAPQHAVPCTVPVPRAGNRSQKPFRHLPAERNPQSPCSSPTATQGWGVLLTRCGRETARTPAQVTMLAGSPFPSENSRLENS